MDEYPQVESRPQSAVLFSTLVILNVIWWMAMIAAIALGAAYLDHCPLQPNIPIYLIVLGATNLFALSLTYSSRREKSFSSILISCCMTVLHLFTFCWFIAGTSWIYPIYPPNYKPGIALYCHKTTYQFAFIVTTLVWVAISFTFVCGCCFALLTCCGTVTIRHRLIPNRYSFYGATRNSEEPGGDV
uniref:transmembrane protein 272-like n=1 Tax=Semicossyphus pulcher TaxID=241346 RepID=UPI0037E90974